jgi:UDP-N-acetylglucosamine transferase subunit ALG13
MIFGTGVQTVRDIQIEDKLGLFIKEFSADLCSLELLIFFGRHPHARFNSTAVLHALTIQRFDTNAALKVLVEKKVVVSHFENGIFLYSLTKEEPAHSLVTQLVNIDQGQWQTIIEHILNGQGIS